MPEFKFFEWALGAISALLGLLYIGNNRRLDRLEENGENNKRFVQLEALCADMSKRMPSEFEREEMMRQRVRTEQNISRIFETLDEMKDRATSRHLELLEKIEEKMDKP